MRRCVLGIFGSFVSKTKEHKNKTNGGDTEFLLDLIDDPLVTSFDLRNELLLASPRVTDEVMIAAIQRDPEMNPWHLAQALLANSPLTQRVLNVLAHSDVNPYYKELVEDGQNGGMTNTTLMEMELVHFGGEMETARADYIRQAYRQDSTGVFNDSIVYYLSDGATDAHLQTLLAYHLKRGQFDQADSLLSEAQNMRWSDDYVDVVSIVLNALSDTANGDSIVLQNTTTLLAVASESSPEAYLAQSVLEIYGHSEFEDVFVMPGDQNKSLFKDKTETKTRKTPIASIHPNPTKGMVYLNWRLPEGLPSTEVNLQVYNAKGALMMSQFLNQEIGIIEINTSNWSTGLYIYQLQHESRKIHSEKFEVLR